MGENTQLSLEKTAAQYSLAVIDWIQNDLKGNKISMVAPPGYDWKTEVETALLYIFQNCNLSGVSPDSIMSGIRDMVLQGLSVTRKQIYPIPKAGKLTMQRSVYGTEAALLRMFPNFRVTANVLYEGDEYHYAYDDVGGYFYVTDVKARIENIGKQIIAAFGQIYDAEKKERVYACVMSWDEIQQMWAKSSDKSHSTHRQFPQEMAKRSLINRMCKHYINAARDQIDPRVMAAYNRSSDAEYEDDRPIRDVTPPENEAERQRLIKGRSQGAKGLEAILQQDSKPAEAPSEPETPPDYEEWKYNAGPMPARGAEEAVDANGMVDGSLFETDPNDPAIPF